MKRAPRSLQHHVLYRKYNGQDSEISALNYGDVAPKREQVIVRRWTDTTDTYRGSNNICGSVSFSQPISFERSGYDIFDDVRLIASQSMIQNYRAAIDGMTADAESIAARIRAGDNQEALREMGVNAVNRARSTYIAGISDDLLEEGSPAYEQYLAAIEDVQTATLEKVTQDGWLLAASWQRGISLAVAEYRSSLGNLEIKAAAENNASRYISRHDLDSSIWTGRDANPIASAVMASMADYQNIWSTVAGQIAGDVRRNGAGASGMAGGAGEVDGILNNLFSSMVDMFAVRDDAGYSDPMIDVTEYGHGLIIAGGAVKAAAKASDWAPLAGAAVGGPGGYAAGVVVDQVGDVLLHPLGTGLLIAGFIVAAILPLLPVIYYFSAIISWLILVVESMFGLPLAVLTLFTPARDGTLIGTWNRVLLTIFGDLPAAIFTVAGSFWDAVDRGGTRFCPAFPKWRVV
jgi:conjugal transfer/type IV secretion protein DotA/TraY